MSTTATPFLNMHALGANLRKLAGQAKLCTPPRGAKICINCDKYRPGAATAVAKVTGVIVTARVGLRRRRGAKHLPLRLAQRKFCRCLGVKRPVS
eukprot:scaffold23653_cov96-Phaeocystis_antarctica.AAC.6